MASMPDNDLLSTLRALPEEAGPTRVDQIITQMLLENNHLEDIKLKLSINNELLLELVALMKGKTCSDFGSQVSPIRNKPFPSPIRNRYGKHHG